MEGSSVDAYKSVISEESSGCTKRWKITAFVMDAYQRCTSYLGRCDAAEEERRRRHVEEMYAEDSWKETEMKRIEHETELKKVWLRKQAEIEKKRLDDLKLKEYRCETCDAFFLTGNDLEKHQKVHEARQQLRCLSPNCGAFFDTSEAMTRHYEAIHNGMQVSPVSGHHI